MNDLDDKFYQDRLDLFLMDGWVDLVNDLNDMADSIDSIKNIDNSDNLHYAKGQLSVLEMLLSMEETTKLQMEQEEY